MSLIIICIINVEKLNMEGRTRIFGGIIAEFALRIHIRLTLNPVKRLFRIVIKPVF